MALAEKKRQEESMIESHSEIEIIYQSNDLGYEELIYNKPVSEPGSQKYQVSHQVVKNYLPNFKTKRWDGVDISIHGYVTEVASRMRKFTCF